MPKVSPDLSHLDVQLSLEHDQAQKSRPRQVAAPSSQGPSALRFPFDSARQNAEWRASNTSITGPSSKSGYEDSMTTSSIKSTDGRSSITTSPSFREARSSGQTGERRKSSMGGLVDKAKAKLGRRPGGAEPLAGDGGDFQSEKAKEAERQQRTG
ncbi:hypothetical protein B0A55_06671 [Friedmanniomyces simplex]|uniref:Uncharacterized protein n=1 Tax=Friedmanniomyces simplex TaxID=329884 RepID=A0A4U0XKU7_9PEZI|nr:hypothetical protein B0A55_06671 [Friedmanniomyces simplex]